MTDRDHLAEYVAEVRDECRDDVLAGDIAEALVRNAGMAYLDMTSPEEAAHIAARVARERLHGALDDEGMRAAGWVRLAGVRAEVEFIRSLGADEGHVIETGWPEATAAFDRLWNGTSHAEA